MQFTRLRLVGFKSFVEPTDLLIEAGLTGVVGPNGCGKSNLVEALRWVMGETSARQMRGSEMDDVIFGGTTTRPARNLAEVTLSVDNGARRAPAQFNDNDDLDITRRIERGAGSLYRINGRDVRARDVQLLFADAATGAHSPSLVSQGRIGALISAKPTDRRSLLEDAAGIAGLHSRRHEAELRLRGAETNLARLDDVLTALDQQLQNLRRQARQAQRYRSLSEQVRKAEAIVLAIRLRAAIAARTEAGAVLLAAQERVGATAGAAASAATIQADQASGLPALRQAEAAAAAELQRLVLARGELDGEERRVAEQARSLVERRRQIDGDLQREQALEQDAASALARLREEAGQIDAARSGEAAAQGVARAAFEAANATAEASEAELSALSQKLAGDEARRAGLDRRIGELDQRRQKLARDHAVAVEQRGRVAAELADDGRIGAAAAAAAAADERLRTARRALEATGEARTAAAAAEADAARTLQAADAARTRAKAEAAALADVLRTAPSRGGSPVMDQLSVEAGTEAALAAALGDDLAAPLGTGAREPVRWDVLDAAVPMPPLPAGATPLAGKVDAPPALTRRLAATGLVPDAETGARLQPLLVPGQRLVTAAGDLWRWDGFVRVAGAPSATAARLSQRNRLTRLTADLTRLETERTAAAEAHAATRQATAAAAAAENAARAEERSAAAAEGAARDARSRLETARAAAQARLGAFDETIARLGAEADETAATIAEATAQKAALPDPAVAREQAAALRADLAEKRTAVVGARAEHDRLLREAQGRARRLSAIADESRVWQDRLQGTAKRLADLAARREAAAAEAGTLESLPAEIARKRTALLEAIGRAEAARREAGDRLAAGEARLAEADRALRGAEAEAASAREAQVRAEAAATAAVQAAIAVAERIRERLDSTPAGVWALAELEENGALPALDEAQARLDRLAREREGMGPVNLRAEDEAAELEMQMTTLATEKDDLVQAIQRLRGAIASLNREGRERLLASFEKVNAHFQELFVRLFGGGRAHLELTESDDPLSAGLEIMASPPGKKLQVLSLLSGGEQALTALSLIFAVFMTNPSPICVLDEVDAPLDDANVDRFCALLTDMAEGTGTRFLVITHHRMTMARMDRLFGVTMAERGISQLVSVDLSRAERLRATA